MRLLNTLSNARCRLLSCRIVAASALVAPQTSKLTYLPQLETPKNNQPLNQTPAATPHLSGHTHHTTLAVFHPRVRRPFNNLLKLPSTADPSTTPLDQAKRAAPTKPILHLPPKDDQQASQPPAKDSPSHPPSSALSLFHSQPCSTELAKEEDDILPEYLHSEGLPALTSKPADKKHAVVSTFDLFSIGIGPSSSHTVGPMRAAKIFTNDLKEAGVLDRVKTLKVALYGSLAATGKGHLSLEALIAGFEGHSCETVDKASIPTRYRSVCKNKSINLGLALDPDAIGHPVQMLFSVYDVKGNLIANNTYFSISGGFVVNTETQFSGENLYYKQIDKRKASSSRLDPFKQLQPLVDSLPLSSQLTSVLPSIDPPPKEGPPFPFHNCDSLLELTRKHNLTIAQIVYVQQRTQVLL
ncbi:hypothetical protein PtA15_9A242 [Puccinia triticina]|uniref:Serine dehydratase beta chain domain-containing protein n=1 Tax=Puccinia triticina TaxID=208348 RepID=A0ABY7CUK6_9BASI|nr:uncharacterized protein PtA15_9A242 [Puccinia triticina]WAQ88117.1 hypothetical protein PtA15_9A242 [Puccinia triticina]